MHLLKLFFCRYFYIHTPEHSEQWQAALSSHAIEGHSTPTSSAILHHLLQETKPTTVSQQFRLLSSISNYHWWQYPRADGQRSSESSCVGLGEHLVYQPDNKYKTKSPRNRLIHFTLNSDIGILKSHIRHIINIDTSDIHLAQFHSSSHSAYDDELQPPPPKRRRRATQKANINPDQLAQQLGISHPSSNCSSGTSLFSAFSEKILSKIGTSIWRQQTNERNVFILNDYNIETGNFMPNNFVHVTYFISSEPSIKCTCSTYRYLSACVVTNTDEDEDILLDERDGSLTCMHCRFIKKHYNSITFNSTATSNLQIKISNSSDLKNSPVVPVGQSSPFQKFSVIPSPDADQDEECNFIHISADGQHVMCMSALCVTKMQAKKKMKKFKKMSDVGILCPHLQTLRASVEVLDSHVPHDVEAETSSVHEENTDDHDLYDSQV